MPIDHLSLFVPPAKLNGLITFLVASLNHMGFKELPRPDPNLAGIGEPALFFWLSGLVPEDVDEKSLDSLLKHSHVAFAAENREQVEQFHTMALNAGATCNGPPGLRPQYSPAYYAAFVIDPVCGVNFEVVCLKGKEVD